MLKPHSCFLVTLFTKKQVYKLLLTIQLSSLPHLHVTFTLNPPSPPKAVLFYSLLPYRAPWDSPAHLGTGALIMCHNNWCAWAPRGSAWQRNTNPNQRRNTYVSPVQQERAPAMAVTNNTASGW